MGANPFRPSQKTDFYNITFGKIARSVPVNTEGAEARENKNGKLVYELFFRSLTGVIKDLEIIEDKEYGDKLHIVIDDIGERSILQIPIESRFFGSFANKLPCIPENSVVTIVPYDFEGKDSTADKPKKIVGINVHLGTDEKGEKVVNFFSKDNPGDMPKFPESNDKADVQIWLIEVRRFFKKLIMAEVPRFKSPVVPPVGNAPAADEQDDLPF